MKKPYVMSEEARQRKRERDAIRNRNRPKKGRVKLTEEERKQRRKEALARYSKKKAKEIEDYKFAAPTPIPRFCRDCGEKVAMTSYYYCDTHKPDWGTEENWYVLEEVKYENTAFEDIEVTFI